MDERNLSRIPLFTFLPLDDLRHFSNNLHGVEVSGGDYAFREREPGDRFHIVLSGQFEVVRSIEAPEELKNSYRAFSHAQVVLGGAVLPKVECAASLQKPRSARSLFEAHFLQMPVGG
jgi:hypothetical protein